MSVNRHDLAGPTRRSLLSGELIDWHDHAVIQLCYPLRGVANYQDIYKLTYLRGPSGILVMLAEELKKS